MSHDVFISHSSIDKNIADAVTAALEQAQIRCWIAPRDILPGESWGGSIIDAIEASQVMVIVFSSHSNDSKQVMREVERAVQKDVIVVPFRVEAVEPSRDMEYFLSATHWLDAVTPELGDHLQNLATTVQSLINKANAEVGGAKNLTAATQVPPATPPTPTAKLAKKPLLSVAIGMALLLLGAWWWMSGDNPTTDLDTAKIDAGSPAPSAAQLGSGDIKLKADSSALGATEIKVTWSGAAVANDRIMIAKADAADSVALQRAKIGDAKAVSIKVPAHPGDYEIRYLNSATRTVISRRALKVKAPDIDIRAPREADVGGELEVGWTAPNNNGDFLAIAKHESPGGKYFSYSSTRAGSPTKIRVPDIPGEYQLRYVSGLEKAVWAHEKLKVNSVAVSLQIPAASVAGASVAVEWQGPANRGDYLAVAQTTDEASEYINYVSLNKGKKAVLKMPEQPGQYEVRYISSPSKEIWAAEQITVLQPTVSLQAPAQARAGTEVAVQWQGPANRGDYVAVAEPNSESKQYLSYVSLRPDSKIKSRMPDTPGSYVIRYVSAAKKHIWAETELQVLPQTYQLRAPSQVAPDSRFSVTWEQSGNRGDYIGVFKQGADNNTYESYAYTNDRKSRDLTAPAESGQYEIRYISGQERLTWGTVPLVVQ